MINPERNQQSDGYFGLDAERVTGSLEEIRQDPVHALKDLEAAYLEFQNPFLSQMLVAGGRLVRSTELTGYTEGALTAHKVIREAGTSDGVLPQLSAEGKARLGDPIVEALRNSQGSQLQPASTAATVRVALAEAIESEPSLHELVGQLADQRLDRDAYYAGASTVIAGLRIAIEELKS
jgi:hypothetical protein